MNEMYWITRLDGLHEMLFAFIVIGIIALCFYLPGFFVFQDEDAETGIMKGLRVLVVIGAVSATAKVFVPTENDMLIIYGVGGTIDYIKQNDIAKQIPDKCIQALDVWVEEALEDKKEELKQ